MRRMFTGPAAALSIGLCASPIAAQAVPVQAFTSIELRDGGHVTLRPGVTQRVSLLDGSLGQSRIQVTGDGRLIVDACAARCSRGYRLEVEIVTPSLSSLAVRDGGILQVGNGFPGQASLTAFVSDGGIIDARSMAAETIEASVEEGGAVYVRPRARLQARVHQGGVVTYWGTPAVRSSVLGGGAVVKGRESDASKSLAQLGPLFPPPPPAVPQVPGLGGVHER